LSTQLLGAEDHISYESHPDNEIAAEEAIVPQRKLVQKSPIASDEHVCCHFNVELILYVYIDILTIVLNLFKLQAMSFYDP